MFVLSKRNIEIPAPGGSKSIRRCRGEMSDPAGLGVTNKLLSGIDFRWEIGAEREE